MAWTTHILAALVDSGKFGTRVRERFATLNRFSFFVCAFFSRSLSPILCFVLFSDSCGEVFRGKQPRGSGAHRAPNNDRQPRRCAGVKCESSEKYRFGFSASSCVHLFYFDTQQHLTRVSRVASDGFPRSGTALPTSATLQCKEERSAAPPPTLENGRSKRKRKTTRSDWAQDN